METPAAGTDTAAYDLQLRLAPACARWPRNHHSHHFSQESTLRNRPISALETAIHVGALGTRNFLRFVFVGQSPGGHAKRLRHRDSPQNHVRCPRYHCPARRAIQFRPSRCDLRHRLVFRQTRLHRRRPSRVDRHARRLLPRCFLHRPRRCGRHPWLADPDCHRFAVLANRPPRLGRFVRFKL